MEAVITTSEAPFENDLFSTYGPEGFQVYADPEATNIEYDTLLSTYHI